MFVDGGIAYLRRGAANFDEIQDTSVIAPRPMLVGEDNPHSSDPRHALYPSPPGCSGARLCAILGMDWRDYLRAFDRADLCSGRWDAAEARETAAEIRRTGAGIWHVLCGAKVARAFGLDPATVAEPAHVRQLYEAGGGFVVVPHPSGRSRIWSDPTAAKTVRETLVKLGIVPRRELP